MKLKKIYKQLLISFFTAIITVFVTYGGYLIYAQDPLDFEGGLGLSPFPASVYNDLIFADVYNSYHGEMNDYFNAKLVRLNELIDAGDFDHKDFSPPPQQINPNLDPVNDSVNEIVEKCGTNNVSTYCVSMGALDIYLRYVRVLKNMEGQLAQTSDASVSDLIRITKSRNEDIDKEIGEAKKVMEATVAAYNEYRLAYPMHKKYQEIAKNLILYKSALKQIQRELISWPVEFVDASTYKCP